jgi:hypothetical protein
MSEIDATTISCLVENDAWLHLQYPDPSGKHMTGCLWELTLIAGSDADATKLLAHNEEAINSYGASDARISALEAENERLRKALENAAIVAECHSDDRPGRDRPFDWNDGYIDGCRGAAAAIRAALEAKP